MKRKTTSDRQNAKSTLGVLFDESNKIAKDILLDEPKNNNESYTRNCFFRRGVKRVLPLSPVPLQKVRGHILYK